MVKSILRKALGVAAVAGGAAVAAAGARYAASRRINAADKLANALLDGERLEQASGLSSRETETALAACAAYMINMAYNASSGMSAPPAMDAVGFERRAAASDGVSTASVITTAHEPESRWQFEMEMPGIVRVTGSRRLVSARFNGPRAHMRTPDTVAIRFENGYAANIESDLEFTSNLVQLTGQRTQLFGAASLSDNRGNVARLRIENTGVVGGTVTRGADIVGRFEGCLPDQITFRQYQIGE